MGYSLHIRREDALGERQPIAIDDWRAAVATVPCLRMKTEASRLVSPSGGVIVFPCREGDVEMFDEKSQEWIWLFCWHQDAVSFASRSIDVDSPEDPIRKVASLLAHRLSAKIFGDGGEQYDW